MAWWEGVDETHLLIASGNYLPSSPPLDSTTGFRLVYLFY